MKKRILFFLFLVIALTTCKSAQVSLPSPAGQNPSITPTLAPSPTTAPAISPTPSTAPVDLRVDGDCGEYPGDAQVGPGIFGVVNNSSVYVCVADADIGGDDPTVDVTLQSGAGEHAFSWRFDDSTGLLRRLDKAENNALFDSHLVYGETSLELRIGTGQRSTSGLPQGESLDLTRMIIRAYNMALDGRALVELQGQYPLISVDQDDPDTVVKADPVMQFDDGRSQLADLFEVPEGYEVRVVGDKPQIPGVWDIQSGGDAGFFVFSEDAPYDMINFFTFGGDYICTAELGFETDEENNNIYHIFDGPGESIFAVTDHGFFKVYPNCKSKLFTLDIQGYDPVAYSEEIGFIVNSWGGDEWYIYDEQGMSPNNRIKIAEGYSVVDAMLFTPNNELIIWDINTGMHKIDLSAPYTDEVIYDPGHREVVDIALNPLNPKEVYHFKYEEGLNIVDINTESSRHSGINSTLCLGYDSANFIFTPDGDIIVVQNVMGHIYKLDVEQDSITIFQKGLNTTALDIADDGTIFAGYTGCQGSGYIKKTAPDGSTTLFSEELPVQVRKLKTQGDLVYVLGVNSLGWDILNPELTVLNQAGEIEYSVDLPQLSFDNLSVSQKETVLLCDHWRNRCVEAGREGVIRDFSVNFNAADPSNANQTSDQPMAFTNQAPGEDIIFAYLGFHRGMLDGTPTTDRYIMEFDVESRTFTPLLQTRYTGTRGSAIPLESYLSSDNDFGGFFFIIGPKPMEIYHVSPEGRDFIRNNTAESVPSSLGSLLHETSEGVPVIQRIGAELPQDAWGIGARMTEDGAYTVIASSLGLLQFYPIP